MKRRKKLTYLLFAFCVLDIIDFDNLGILDVGVMVIGGILAALKIYEVVVEGAPDYNEDRIVEDVLRRRSESI